MPKRSSRQPASAMACIISVVDEIDPAEGFPVDVQPAPPELAAEVHDLLLAGDEELVLEEEQVHAGLVVQDCHLLDDVRPALRE